MLLRWTTTEHAGECGVQLSANAEMMENCGDQALGASNLFCCMLRALITNGNHVIANRLHPLMYNWQCLTEVIEFEQLFFYDMQSVQVVCDSALCWLMVGLVYTSVQVVCDSALCWLRVSLVYTSVQVVCGSALCWLMVGLVYTRTNMFC